jgi:hypothetical protein
MATDGELHYKLPRNVSRLWLLFCVIPTLFAGWLLLGGIGPASVIVATTAFAFGPLYLLSLSLEAVELHLKPSDNPDSLVVVTRWGQRVIRLSDLKEIELRDGPQHSLSSGYNCVIRKRGLIYLSAQGTRKIRLVRVDDDGFEPFLESLRRVRPGTRLVESGIGGWRRRVRE